MTRTIWFAGAFAAIVMISFGTGCKKLGGATTDVSATVRPVPSARSDGGWPLYTISAEGFELSLPPDWRQIDMNPKTFEATMQQLLQQNPALAPMLGNLRQQLQAGCKFFGLDPESAKAGFAVNVNVMRNPLPPGGTLDSIIPDVVRQLESLPGAAKPITQERIKSPSGDRERLHYLLTMRIPNGQNLTVAITQYVLVKDKDLFTVTMGAKPDEKAKFTQIFDKVGMSFRFMK
jgi:hypothetical protein